MNDSIKMWGDRTRWPRSTPEAVFLFEAVHEVGKAVYGEAWTGREPLLPEPYNLMRQVGPLRIPVPLSGASKSQKFAASRLHAQAGLGSFPISNMNFTPQPTEKQWEQACELADAADKANAGSKLRFERAKSMVCNALLEGVLISVLRPRAGGAFSLPLPRHLWNSENLGPRFYWGQMNLRKPFDHGIGGDDYQYIFILRDWLERYVRDVVANKELASQPEPAVVVTAASEKKAELHLADLLQKKQTMTKAEAQDAISAFGISVTGFRTRVWPRARARAGLPPMGQPGRPPNREGPAGR